VPGADLEGRDLSREDGGSASGDSGLGAKIKEAPGVRCNFLHERSNPIDVCNTVSPANIVTKETCEENQRHAVDVNVRRTSVELSHPRIMVVEIDAVEVVV
jgi:hypothetical protein